MSSGDASKYFDQDNPVKGKGKEDPWVVKKGGKIYRKGWILKGKGKPWNGNNNYNNNNYNNNDWGKGAQRKK